MKTYFVYILTNQLGNVMYIGITNDLTRRIYEHMHKLVKGFTTKYNVDKLIYYEQYGDVREAITREKQLKGWTRAKKNTLVESMNPDWKDLIEDWYVAGDSSLRSE